MVVALKDIDRKEVFSQRLHRVRQGDGPLASVSRPSRSLQEIRRALRSPYFISAQC
jgi:hypothetical protein